MPAFYKEWFWRARLKLMSRVFSKPQPRPLLFVGSGSAQQLCHTIARFGLHRLLIVTDKPLLELGLHQPLVDALESRGVTHVIYDGVLPDPTQQVVDDGLDLLESERCDSVLAFGGGSSIDAAKVIALAAGNNCRAADCIGLNPCSDPALPLFAIPTTAGTGSEATWIAVISDNETHQKNASVGNALIPRAAALDPSLMQGLPSHITAATGMDALTHAIESYIGTWETSDTNAYGLTACKLIFDNLETACSDGANLEAREAMAVAAYYGGLAISNALVGYVHAVSHNIGARYGIPHGLGNAMALPRVLERLKTAAAPRLAEIALHCRLGELADGEEALAQAVIDRVWALNRAIGIPDTTDKIREEDIEELADLALAEGSAYPTPRFFEREEAVQLIRALKAA